MSEPNRTNEQPPRVDDENPGLVVAIDGPAGSGKSSVSKAVALKCGFAFLDTGAVYRALTWFVVEEGNVAREQQEALNQRDWLDPRNPLDPLNPRDVIDLLPQFDVAISTDPLRFAVGIKGLTGFTDVTDAIREPRISFMVSSVARIPQVRDYLTELFRSIIQKTITADNGAAAPMPSLRMPGIVVEGRDITTVVAANADVRILLTASQDVRIARRSAEITTQSSTDVAQKLGLRDTADSQVVDFMNAAEGVVTVDSTALNFDATVEAVIAVISEKTAALRSSRTL